MIHSTYSLLTFSDSSSFVYSVRAMCRHNIIHAHKSSSGSDSGVPRPRL